MVGRVCILVHPAEGVMCLCLPASLSSHLTDLKEFEEQLTKKQSAAEIPFLIGNSFLEPC